MSFPWTVKVIYNYRTQVFVLIVDWIEPACPTNRQKLNNQPDTQYSVFWLKVKYIMLCMVLWREGEYPVDKSVFLAEMASAKAPG
jgi:hypothetical protein